ncbi:MAG: aldo/keto reductase family protein [Limnochordia bacterium]|jgi:voltage-dependent potassium channel beta subunit|nr:aldo/keto reductase family protein [Limnochordia bacterium]MDI9464026.1 aldo/keto reductase family protein [Bacillota bacterium]NLO96324.1 aldo/keto reductase [Bacillota bacterium]HAN94537.1 aldo/keto reductase [Bacillota bacterium]HOB39450.1 aldo/keto reductase family protein [Limnochordia bacterium]
MKYRKLGRSGLKVSEISLGSWLTYGKSVEEERAIKTIRRAYELGVNSFDSANVYERGEGERVMAKALRVFPRESYIITTKAFWPMGDGPNDRGLSRKHVFEQLHASLKRMELDYVDIFYCHRYDPETPVEETLRTIDDLVRQGKVLYVGVSEWTAAQIEEAVRIADRYLLDRIVVNQPVYNMLNRYIEKEVIPVCAKHGIGQIVFSPLAQGVLTGKYRGGRIPEGSRAANPEINEFIKGLLEAGVLQKVDALQDLAEEAGMTLVEMALAWVLRQPNVASALVGASRPEQIEANVKAVDVELSQELLEKIEEILA